MAEIEIGAATIEEYPQIAAMDLSFESDHVWKTQTLDGFESFEANFQRIRLPNGYLRLEQDETANRLVLKTGGIMPEYRNKGIGSVLLTRVMEIAHHNNLRSIVCMVQAKNDPAIHFLLSHGFVFCGYQEFFFRNMEIGLFFSRNVR